MAAEHRDGIEDSFPMFAINTIQKRVVIVRVLGIETSCDEVGVAVYDSMQGLLAHETYTQTSIHAAFGGVVPELASRDHVRKIIPIIQKTFKQCHLSFNDINGIAYTKGPGLVGALLVGAMVGRSLGFALNIPAIGVHHLEGHLLAPFLETDKPTFPFLALLVSGGHTELIKVSALGQYEILGDTLDDAAGEAFDKVGKLLGLGYPAGPAVARLAQQGRSNRFQFPRPMLDRPGLMFSFSGLKTAVLQATLRNTLDEQTKADIARGFEEAVVETLLVKCHRALKQCGYHQLVIAGGVGANLSLRHALKKWSTKEKVTVFFPRHEFCTDNGAMIAYAGCQRLLAGECEDLRVEVYPRWPLSQINQT